MGRALLAIGALIALVGLALVALGRAGMPRLPGDLVIRRGGSTLYIPLATSIVVSIVLSVVLSLVFRRR